MSWTRVWIHMVFTTYRRKQFLHQEEIRFKMFKHIKENAEQKGIWLDCVNGYSEHVHCLISLGKEQIISKIAQLIKGESSYWINRTGFLDYKFSWQDDFWAVSVSESHLVAVRKYIHQQEEHHRKVSFKEEIDLFKEKYGWERIN
ncbi:MAG: transposase [Bacteroidetes bacterium]|jgi:REP element-mobilizing transposase RayT|nr:transposase [Bacteroidota bacterium]